MERYAEYKDSVVFSFGRIPKHWLEAQLKFFCRMKSGDAITSTDIFDDGDYPVYGGNGFRGFYDQFNTEGEYSLVGRQGALCGNVHFVQGRFWATDHAVVTYSSSKIDNKYLHYVLIEMDLNQYSQTAAQPGLSVTTILKQKTIVPELPEQTAIVAYLDRKTAEIDALIADLQSQTEILDRFKRELIAKAVTKGLANSVSMKNSEVDWIGDTPSHWEVTKIKWMFEIVKRIYGKEGRDVISITQRGLKVKDIESNDGQLAESYTNYQMVNVNDFAMNSMDLLTGWVDCSPFDGVTSPDYRVFRFLSGKEQCHNYYKYLFQMCYKNRIFYRLGQGVSNLGRWRLQADQFLNMRFPQPPVEEQEKIAAYLEAKTAQVEGLIADITKQIEKLKQYRQIVIHDAVTGKIKVTEG